MRTRSRLLSAYTPSNTDPEVLKRIFVQRQGFLKRLVDRLSLALLGRKRYHALLIGPRGSGKTHLVTMATHELKQREELRHRLRIAWLGEDDTFTGLIDIALGMGDQLAKQYPGEFPADFREEVRGLKPDDAAEAILTRILERAPGTEFLLVMENLNRAFNGLGDDGQKQWRAFLQNRGRITLLGTSQQLFEGIESRDRPFFGFFDITHLQPMSVDDARALIYKIALEEGREELATFLATPEGRYRVRALHHLAGGNHRLYVQLSEFLTKDSLEDLVTAFEQIEEELTPYFQERLRSLAPQQARIVECLSGAPGAMSVKQIHEETFIPERSCSKQLSLLKQMNYVRGTSSGKETFYELCEPLLRLCLEVKHRRGAPLALVVQFIRAWFPQEKLRSIRGMQEGSSPLMGYLEQALVADGALNKLLYASLCREVDQRHSMGQLELASQLREELEYVNNTGPVVLADAQTPVLDADRNERQASREWNATRSLINQGIEHALAGRFDAAILVYSEVISTPNSPSDLVALARYLRGVAYSWQGDTASAVADCAALIGQIDAPPNLVARAHFSRALAYGRQGNVANVIADCTAVIDQDNVPPDLMAWARFSRGVAKNLQGDASSAVADYTAVIGQVDAPPGVIAGARINRGEAYGVKGDAANQIADYTAVIEQVDAPPDHIATARVNRGVAYGVQGDQTSEITDYTDVIEQIDAPPDQVAQAHMFRGFSYGRKGDINSAIADYTSVIEQVDAPAFMVAEAHFYRGVEFSKQGDLHRAIADYSAVIEQADAQPDQVAKACFNRGVTYSKLGNSDAELSDYTTVIERADSPPDVIAKARIYRGITHGQLGEFSREIADYAAVIEHAGTPPDQIANARFHRGVASWRSGNFESSEEDFRAVLGDRHCPEDRQHAALFAVVEPMIMTSNAQVVASALTEAFQRVPRESPSFGGTPADVVATLLQRGHQDWANYLRAIVPVYLASDHAGELGTAVVRSAGLFDNGEYSAAQMDTWLSAWRTAAGDHKGLHTSIGWLAAALEAIKSRNERPLLSIPLEIRTLVRPLLAKSLGPVESR